MKKKIKVLVVKPDKNPYPIEIDADLKSMQNVVGGDIQAVYPFEDDFVALVCAEEGKLLGYPLNRPLTHPEYGMYDIVAGTFFLCSAPPDAEDFQSLSEEQIKKYTKFFKL